MKRKKMKPSRVLEIGNIFQRFMDKHKTLNHTGSWIYINALNEPERDLEINYKNKDYLIKNTNKKLDLPILNEKQEAQLLEASFEMGLEMVKGIKK